MYNKNSFLLLAVKYFRTKHLIKQSTQMKHITHQLIVKVVNHKSQSNIPSDTNTKILWTH